MERQLRAGVSLFLKIFFQRIPSARAVGCTPRPTEGRDGERGGGPVVNTAPPAAVDRGASTISRG